MVICTNKYNVKEGCLDQMIKELNASGAGEIFRAQPGCIMFAYSADIEEPDVLYLTDVWADEEAFQGHLKCAGIPLWHEVRDKYIVSKDSRRYDA